MKLNMKKLAFLVMALVMVLSLFGCGGTKLDVKDKTTGVSVEAENGVFEKDTKMEIKELSKDSDKMMSEVVRVALDGICGRYTAFDLSAVLDGKKVQPNGEVKVLFPVPAGYSKNLAVYYVSDKGELELIPSEIKESGNSTSLLATLSHFSVYVVGDLDVTHTADVGGNDNPDGQSADTKTMDTVIKKAAEMKTEEARKKEIAENKNELEQRIQNGEKGVRIMDSYIFPDGSEYDAHTGERIDYAYKYGDAVKVVDEGASSEKKDTKSNTTSSTPTKPTNSDTKSTNNNTPTKSDTGNTDTPAKPTNTNTPTKSDTGNTDTPTKPTNTGTTEKPKTGGTWELVDDVCVHVDADIWEQFHTGQITASQTEKKLVGTACGSDGDERAQFTYAAVFEVDGSKAANSDEAWDIADENTPWVEGYYGCNDINDPYGASIRGGAVAVYYNSVQDVYRVYIMRVANK